MAILIINSADLCAAKHRARAQMSAHNGGRRTIRPIVRAAGCKGHKKPKHRDRHGARG